uniref:Bifunctional inhibitor/plant lipid transfer protein/seed storage helical domain-containing protein n=1 Tax=Salix viminalis TaxID=40686 RepID=A0A6N2NAQ5_SALVM
MGLYSFFWVVIFLASASSVHGSDGFPGLLDSVHGSDGFPGLLDSVHGSDGLLDSVHGSDGFPGLLDSVHGSDVCAGLPGLLDCSPFLLGSVSSPDASCCKSLKWLSQHAMKKEDKRELCKCLKVEDLKHKGVILDRTKTLPRLCKVKLPVPLVPDNIDCDNL